jgi:hypothetical protein
MRAQSGLIVRQARRFEIVLPAAVRVASQDAAVLRLGQGVTSNEGWVEMDVCDVAQGGVGLVGTQYFPRGLHVVIRVYPPEGRHADPLFEVPARVMRVRMTDGRPGYMLGTAVVDAPDNARLAITRLLDAIEEDAA